GEIRSGRRRARLFRCAQTPRDRPAIQRIGCQNNVRLSEIEATGCLARRSWAKAGRSREIRTLSQEEIARRSLIAVFCPLPPWFVRFHAHSLFNLTTLDRRCLSHGRLCQCGRRLAVASSQMPVRLGLRTSGVRRVSIPDKARQILRRDISLPAGSLRNGRSKPAERRTPARSSRLEKSRAQPVVSKARDTSGYG